MSVASTALITATNDIIKTIDLLVEAGANITLSDVFLAGNLFATYDIACRLTLAILPSDHRNFFDVERSTVSTLILTAQYADTQASQIIRNMIHHCEIAGCGRCLVEFPKNVEQAAIRAAELGHLEVVRLLIDHVSSPTKIFCAAIRSNRKDLIDFVLSLNPDLNPPAQYLESLKHFRHTTPLAEAVRVGNKEMINHLHSAGAFAQLHKGGRLKPLMLAAACWGDSSFMRQLLSYSDSSSHPCRASSRAINIALRHNHQEVARLLLESGAKVRWGRERGQVLSSTWRSCSLHLSLQGRNKSLIKAILNADIHPPKSQHFGQAFKWGDLSIVADFASICPPNHMDPGTLRNICLRCIQDENIGFFQNFVQSIEDISSLDPCLEGAVGMGHSEMVCYLLDIGANPFTHEVLEVALTSQKEILHLLFDRSRPRRAIFKCIGARIISSVMNKSLDDPQALDALLETRAVNLTRTEHLKVENCAVLEGYPRLEYWDVTPLGFALLSLLKTPDKDPWMVRVLLKAGSDPNGVAKRVDRPMAKNYTGLMVALETMRRDVVQLLFDSGADINLKPHFALKQTPLQYAAELGHLDMVCMLLEQGADVNAEPAIRSGGTALQFAAISGNCNIASVLLANGALLNALPSKVEGRWPLEGAAEHGRLDMIQFLWTEATNRGGSDFVAGFQRRHCLRAMNFARKNGHMGCRDLISDLSGIPVDRLDIEDYGAPWLAYSDSSYSSSDGDSLFPMVSSECIDDDNDGDRTDYSSESDGAYSDSEVSEGSL